MPDTSPFNVTGFVAPGRAYRLISQGITPPTPEGAGRQTAYAFAIASSRISGGAQSMSNVSGVLTNSLEGQSAGLSSVYGSLLP